MQIVINIPKDLYEGIERRDGVLETEYVCDELMKAVDNGVLLPKRHGRLIDVRDAVDNLMEYKEIGIFGNCDKLTIRGCIDRIENHVKPIIEADQRR